MMLIDSVFPFRKLQKHTGRCKRARMLARWF